MIIEAFIEHFDAIVLFSTRDGSVVLSNGKFHDIIDRKIQNIGDLEAFFIEYYLSEQIPIFNIIKINFKNYLVKRKILKNLILYHFEENNYYINIIDTIKKQNGIDELTQCYNRKEFENIFNRLIASTKRYDTYNFTVLMFDIDHFKHINDTYGHLAGDYVLKTLSELIRNILRDSDIFARIGGEEFVILLPQTKLHGALKTAQKIKNNVENYKFSFQSFNMPVTISIGITSVIKKDSQFSILDRVDKALYKAKNNGRNCIEYL